MDFLTSLVAQKNTSNEEPDIKQRNRILALLGISVVSISGLIYVSQKLKIKPHPSVPWIKEPHPYLGHGPWRLSHLYDFHEIISNIINGRKLPISCIYADSNYIHFLNTPELIDWVFTDEFEKFEKTPRLLRYFKEIFGNYGEGIFNSDGLSWRFHRKIFARMFSVRNVQNYMYNCCVKTTGATMSKISSLLSQNTEIDINDILGRMTFDCFTSIAFGVSFDSMQLYPKKHPFGKSFDRALTLLTRRLFDPFFKLKKKFKMGLENEIRQNAEVIDKFCKEMLKTRSLKGGRNIKDESGKNTFDLLSLYTTYEKNLTQKQLKTLALHLLIAGRDTTRTLLSWFLYDLCRMPEMKKRVYEEIDDLNLSGDEPPSYKIVSSYLNGLQYLECCLAESLRYRPVIPSLIRFAVEDIEVPQRVLFPDGNGDGKKYVIRKGERVVVHNHTTCRNERFYKNPEEFKPERFASKGVRTFPPNVYTFFNLNPRLCQGRDFALMEAKIFLVYFMRTYDFELVPGQEIVGIPGPILNFKNGLKLKLTPRK